MIDLYWSVWHTWAYATLEHDFFDLFFENASVFRDFRWVIIWSSSLPASQYGEVDMWCGVVCRLCIPEVYLWPAESVVDKVEVLSSKAIDFGNIL